MQPYRIKSDAATAGSYRLRSTLPDFLLTTKPCHRQKEPKMSSITDYTTEELIKRWDTLAMLADEYIHATNGQEDEDYTRQMVNIEAELNSRGLGLTGQPFIEQIDKVERKGNIYIWQIKLWKTSFGNAMWNVTSITTGQGLGGFTLTLTQAYSEVSKIIDGEAPDHD